MRNGKKIVLASASPRRKEILSRLVAEFEIRPADIDETTLPGEAVRAYTERMAYEKMRKCAEQTDEGTLVIGSDTTVCINGQILGKPTSAEHARDMLRLLNGKDHLVTTAVSMCLTENAQCHILRTTDEIAVRFRHMSEVEIDGFIASGVPMGKAGAYAIQDREFHPVESINGCYTGVMGFPLCHTAAMLRKMGIPLLREDLSAACQSATDYICPSFPKIEISDYMEKIGL